ncbi:hypothetical protein [Rhodanobacter sp. B05]|nr:hypothetical protein [Rhodanobacter sp. B05]
MARPLIDVDECHLCALARECLYRRGTDAATATAKNTLRPRKSG